MTEAYSTLQEFEKVLFYPKVHTINTTADYRINSEFVIPGLLESIENSQTGFFLSKVFVDEIGLNEYLLRSSSFTHMPEWSVGREDSSQGVFFGYLNLTIDKGQYGKSITIPVAIKPYHTKKRLAIHEFAAQNLVNKSPGLKTYSPLGLMVDETGCVNLITVFEEDVKTLDNINWDLDGSDALDDHLDPFRALTSSAKILALMHSAGFVHGDAQIKNMGLDKNRARPVDLTTMRRFLLADFSQDVNARQMILRDFNQITRSVIEKRYLMTEDSRKRAQIIGANLISPYVSMMRHPSLPFACDKGFQDMLTSVTETFTEEL